MQLFENLPWYGYIIFGIAALSYAFRYFKIAKKEADNSIDLRDVKFKKSTNRQLTEDQLFGLALYTPISEWWEANSNSLSFLEQKDIQPYLEGWGIDTQEGYWGLTEYFMQDGRRWYFDYIMDMIRNEPKEKWEKLMETKFGVNERAYRYLETLSSGKLLTGLKHKGFLTFDSEIELGVAGYDAAILVGQARKAYTGGLITEEEAWKVINFARKLALEQFSSWEEFGKSFIIGFDLDMGENYPDYKEEVLHIYKQVVENPNSPLNTIQWPQ